MTGDLRQLIVFSHFGLFQVQSDCEVSAEGNLNGVNETAFKWKVGGKKVSDNLEDIDSVHHFRLEVRHSGQNTR